MAVLDKTITMTDSVVATLAKFKTSVDELIAKRIGKLELTLERRLADLDRRLLQLEVKHAALEAEQRQDKPEIERIEKACDQHMEAVETRIETRLAALERKVNGPHPVKITKRVERDSSGLIAKIIEE